MKRTIVIILFFFGYTVGVAQHKHERNHELSTVQDSVRAAAPRTVVYRLYVSDTTVSYTGKHRKAIAINGQIPAPTLYFTEGDTAEIHVYNRLKTETSLHWHGLILPNRMDGVPYLTTAPIEAGKMAVYRFPIVQNGTYWYHSHTKLQEQSGMYGALVIHKRNEPPMKEVVLVLSDWTNERPAEVHRSLRAASDWYMIKKGATQSYLEAITSGNFGVKVANEWKRMHAMDVSDVYYDALLANGQQQVHAPLGKGEKLRLRVVNGSSSTYFWLQFSGSKLSVVANDGMDVVPVEVDRLIIGVAETYDMIVSIPDNMSYEFRATAEDRTAHTSLWLGDGMKMPAPDLPKLDYFAGMKMMNGMMRMNGDLDDMGMNMSVQKMDMNEVMYPELNASVAVNSDSSAHQHHEGMDMSSGSTQRPVTLNYGMLRSPVKTTLPDAPWRELRFTLEGNMNRYVWTLDNKVVSEADRILIKQGENVRIVMYNNSMMRHPMHLHGHFFRLLNGQGDYAPLKNVVDIMPMETDTLEFAATESGDWFFHCHILYHMMSGMGRVFSYEDSPPNPDIPNPKKANRKFLRDDKAIHPMFHIGLQSNGTHGELMLSNTRYALIGAWHTGWDAEHGYNATVRLGRYLGKMQYWFPYIAWDYHYSSMHTESNRNIPMVGLSYKLPLLFVADLQADFDGHVRLNLSRKDIALSPRLRLDMEADTDWEYRFDLRYILTKYFSIAGNYDSGMGWGGGIVITY